MLLLSNWQGEVYIRGKKRVGLVSDDDISGLRIGLVSFRIIDNMVIFKCYSVFIVILFYFCEQVFQSAALFDSLTVRENVGFLL